MQKLKESKISKTFSERITRTCILLILAMLFLMPIFSDDSYVGSVSSF